MSLNYPFPMAVETQLIQMKAERRHAPFDAQQTQIGDFRLPLISD